MIVAAVAGASYYVLNRDEVSVVGNKTTNSAASGITAYKQVDACSVLQPADAEFAIGQGAKKSDSGGSNTASDDITVSSCLYYKTDVLVSGYKSASLLVRVAKTAVGSANNKSQFGSQKPANVQDVAELGEAAYWSPEYGQLNRS